MAVKYHINPQLGPLPCSAKTPEGCRYGAEAIHYDSTETARVAWEDQLRTEYGATVAHTSRSSATLELAPVRQYDLMGMDEIAALVESDREAYDDVVFAVDRKTKKIDEAWARLIAHSEPEPFSTFSRLSDEYREARQDAAIMESARQNSPFFSSRLKDAMSTDVVSRVGVATRLATSRPVDPSPSDEMIATLLEANDTEVREQFYRQVWGFRHMSDQVEKHAGSVSFKDGFALVNNGRGRVRGICAVPGFLSVSKNKMLLSEGVDGTVKRLASSAPEVNSWTLIAFRDHRKNSYTVS